MTGRMTSAPGGPRSFPAANLRRLVLVAVAAVLVGACGGGAAVLSTVGSSVDGNGGAEAPVPAATAAPAPADLGKSGQETYSQGGPALVTTTGPLIVRTGQIDLQVKSLDEALAAAEKAVTDAGGYVASSQRQGDDDRASASVTYRIPAARWEATLAALRKVGTKVLTEQTASEEVTSQVVDLAARLTNLRATEAALQAIMARAAKIPDVLEVQAQLSSVRQEIEQLTAQKQSLEEQAAMATLTVGFSLPPVVAVTQVSEGWDPAAEVDRAAATLVGLGQGIVSVAIWAVIVLLPLALVLAFVLGFAWLAVRRRRARPAPPAAPAAPLDLPAA
jgi:hypothetical protein